MHLSYCETFRKVWRVIKKRRGMLSHDYVLLHDNAQPHSACVPQTLIDE